MIDGILLTFRFPLFNPSIERPAPFAEAAGGSVVGAGGGIAEVKIE